MLYTAVKYIRDELSANLAMAPDGSSDVAVLGSIHESDGSISTKIDEKIVISLVNVERTNVRGRAPVSSSSNGLSVSVHSAPLHVNIFLLLSASFIDYQQALKKLSSVAGFFQANSDFTRQSFNVIPEGIDKLDIQLENMTFHEMSNLWGMMGGRHFPCLLYKVRMVTIDSHSLKAQLPNISKPTVGVNA